MRLSSRSFQANRNLKGIGIDLVAVSRIKNFLKDHPRKSCQRILTRNEVKFWQKKKYSTLVYSKFFAAKEAFFKAFEGNGLGLAGWRLMEIELLPRQVFHATLSTRKKNRNWQAEGKFFATKECIGAQVILWESENALAAS